MRSTLSFFSILGLLVAGAASAQGIDRRPHPNGGIYGWIQPPPPPVYVAPLDNGHAGYGGSAPTPEQLRSRAARASWESITGVRSRMSVGSRWPARFTSGNDGFLATVAWELSRAMNSGTFQSVYGRPDRGITLYFNYNGNAVQLYIPGTDLGRAVDALSSAASGGTGGYQFFEPPHVPPQIGAPRTQPLMLRLFGPENGSGSGQFWTALGMLNTVNPNRNLSPHSGWIGPQPRSSLAPVQNGTSAVAYTDGMGSGGANVGLGAMTNTGVMTAQVPDSTPTAVGAGMLRL